MEYWIFFALLSSLIWGTTSFIDKIVISRGYIKSPFVYIVLNGLMNVLILFLLPFVGIHPLTPLQTFVAIAFGICMSASIIAYYKAVEHDDISKVVILFQLEPVIILILSFLFLKEKLSMGHLIGFVLILGAGFLVSYRKVEGSFKLNRAFYFMIFSGILASLAYITIKYVYSSTTFWNAFVWTRLANMSAMLVLFSPSIRKNFVATYRKNKIGARLLLAFKMVIDFSAFLALGYALQKAPVSLVNVIATSSLPLFVFFMAIASSVFFPHLVKEDLKAKSVLIKVIAIILIIVGIIFINSA